MKKLCFALLSAMILASCSTSIIIPKALNTVSTASFADLNLERADYEILNTITADAVVEAVYTAKSTTISEVNGEFALQYVQKKTGQTCYHKGVVRLGYLHNDYSYNPKEIMSPEDVARRLAIYRLINVAKLNGADGIIEPTLSTSVEQVGKKIVLKSTVSAKIIKLNTNE